MAVMVLPLRLHPSATPTYRPHCENASAVIAFRDVFNKYD